MPPLLPLPDWTVYAQSPDPLLHPIGPPPLPRGADGQAVSAVSWVTGISADHGVLRTLGVHSATGSDAASLTTWRHTGRDEPSLARAECLVRDMRFYLGPAAAAAARYAVEETCTFDGTEVLSLTVRHSAMTWRSFALGPATVTLAYHDDSPSPIWRRR